MCSGVAMTLLILLIAFNCVCNTVSAIDLYFLNDRETSGGLGWPHSINIIEGNDVLLKLVKANENQQSCTVTTPQGITFNINSPPSNKYETWDVCGVRVKDVVKADEGRWRITSAGPNHSMTGFSEVFVQNDIGSFEPSPTIFLQDGQENQQVDLSVVPNLYCMVTQPFTESSLVPGDCQVHLDKTTRAVQGNWMVSFGVPGRVSEMTMERHVAVEAERLEVGYVHDTVAEKLHLHCNILHSYKEITFCRFQRTSSTSGFNVLDGLSDGNYSYYGKGFLERQCGLTIEHPTAEDFSSWRCSVGVQELVGNNLQLRPPMQALIAVARSRVNTLASREQQAIRQSRNEETTERTVFVQRDQEMTITCNSDFPLTYCWFQAPDGSQYTPTPATGLEQEFWYQGESLGMGDCGIVFAHAKDEFTGPWTCHKGASDLLGVEETDQVEVRVTGALAARTLDLAVNVGDKAELHCHSANGNRPLNYCRFLTPYNLGLNVDPTITEDVAILNQYYFTPETHLDYGDCTLTIKEVTYQDLGNWTCAALLLDETEESRDTIALRAPESYYRAGSRAGMAGGIIAGIVVLAAAAVGVAWHRRGRPLPWRNTASSQMHIVNMNVRTSDASNSTNLSSSSETTRPEFP